MTEIETSQRQIAPAPPDPVTPAARWWPMVVLAAGTFLIVLDYFIVNVGLPSIEAGLHANGGGIEWIVVGYGLPFAVFVIAAGRLGDRFGRRRILSIGFGLFGLASAVCGLAPDTGLLVAARVLQGVGAALISPNVLSLIGVLYTGAARARAISIYGAVMGLAAAGGQLFGGLLVQANIDGLGWRPIFLVNLPVVVVALVVAGRVLPESRSGVSSSIDRVGLALVSLGLLALLLPLVEGRQQGWPLWTWLLLGLAVPIFGLLAAHQLWRDRQGRDTMLDVHLLADRVFLTGLGTQLVYWSSQGAFFLVLALYLQQGRHLDPIHAGLVFTVMAASYLVTSLRAPQLAVRYGPRLITIGALSLAVGFALLAGGVAEVGRHGGVEFLVPGLVVLGFGMGFCITPLTMTVLAHADLERAGAVSGAMSTMQQAGNALGVALTGVIFFGALRGGYPHALLLALAELAAVGVAVAVLSRRFSRVC